jgi:hypothetical protein
MKKNRKTALEICLNKNLTAEEQHDLMIDLGLDLEDMFEIAMNADEKTWCINEF